MASILVTGAAGFIGSHTCDRLLAEGHAVTGVDNLRTGRRANLRAAEARPEFRFAELDVTDAAKFDALVVSARPAALIHLAALVSVQESISDPGLNYQLNVAATQAVAEAARRHRVGRVVFASSAAVYGDCTEIPLGEQAPTRPISPYGGAKLASEALLIAHAATFGFTARCQRYFNVFGPRQDPRSPYSGVISIFCSRLQAGEAPTIFGDGEQTRDFISVHDVARANVLAATLPSLPSGIANICTGTATSLNHLAATLGRIRPQAPAPLHAPARGGDIRHSLGRPQKAREDFGFAAEVSLETGLRELVEAAAPS
ncbi:MAG TPA: SDR family NAD(P)-dependent oxidoreductase [Opitutaceae bacterium]|nr:SDR family NAD(P)-dependent oxidoreductase [Opitutaceae bacterium]